MTTNLDMKNGEFFEAATEYLYQKKIEELQAQLAKERDYSAETHARFEEQNERITELEAEVGRLKDLGDRAATCAETLLIQRSIAVEALELIADNHHAGKFQSDARKALERIRKGE